MNVQPRPHLKAIHRLPETMGIRDRYLRLDRNERTVPFSDQAIQRMRKAIGSSLFNYYPNPEPLYKRLSKQLKIPQSHIYLTNGSDAGIRMLFQAFIDPKNVVVTADPSYAMYQIYATLHQAKIVRLPYPNSLKLDEKNVLEAVRKKPRALLLANPDQPTGSVFSPATLLRFARATEKTGTLMVVDEAYYPFYAHSASTLVKRFSHVVVVRSFSKAWGIAGLRLGYLIASPSILGAIAQVRGAHEVNVMAITAACDLLDHPKERDGFVKEIERGRKILTTGAQRLGLETPPCPTNFQLIRFPYLESTERVVQAFTDAHILVKGCFGAPSLRNAIRITLAGPDAMYRCVAVLEKIVKKGLHR